MEYLDAVIGVKEIYAATHRSLRLAQGNTEPCQAEFIEAGLDTLPFVPLRVNLAPGITEPCQSELSLL